MAQAFDTNTGDAANSVSSISKPVTCLAHDVLLAWVYLDDQSQSVSGMTGGPGGWQDTGYAVYNSGGKLAVWWAYTSGALSGSNVTANASGTCNIGLSVTGIAGAHHTVPFAGHAEAEQLSTAPDISATVHTLQANTLIVSACNNVFAMPDIAGGGFTVTGAGYAATNVHLRDACADAITGPSGSDVVVSWTFVFDTPAQMIALAIAAALPPPSAPSGLAGIAGNNQVSLTWNASSGATSYNVKRATAFGGPYTNLAAGTGIAGTSLVDTTAVNGTDYWYEVSALSEYGEGTASAAVGPRTPLGKPGTPTFTGVTYHGATAHLPSLPAGAATLTLRRTTDLGGAPDPANWGALTTNATPSGTYADNNVASNTAYWDEVIAVNGGGSVTGDAAAFTTDVMPVPTITAFGLSINGVPGIAIQGT